MRNNVASVHATIRNCDQSRVVSMQTKVHRAFTCAHDTNRRPHLHSTTAHMNDAQSCGIARGCRDAAVVAPAGANQMRSPSASRLEIVHLDTIERYGLAPSRSPSLGIANSLSNGENRGCSRATLKAV